MNKEDYSAMSRLQTFGLGCEELYHDENASYFYYRGAIDGLRQGSKLGFIEGVLCTGMLIFSLLYFFPDLKNSIPQQNQTKQQRISQIELSDKLNK